MGFRTFLKISELGLLPLEGLIRCGRSIDSGIRPSSVVRRDQGISHSGVISIPASSSSSRSIPSHPIPSHPSCLVNPHHHQHPHSFSFPLFTKTFLSSPSTTKPTSTLASFSLLSLLPPPSNNNKKERKEKQTPLIKHIAGNNRDRQHHHYYTYFTVGGAVLFREVGGG